MKIRTAWSIVVFSGLIAVASATSSLARSGNHGASVVAKESVTPVPKGEARHARPHLRKQRYWRHRGGSHPHYGSRRIRH